MDNPFLRSVSSETNIIPSIPLSRINPFEVTKATDSYVVYDSPNIRSGKSSSAQQPQTSGYRGSRGRAPARGSPFRASPQRQPQTARSAAYRARGSTNQPFRGHRPASQNRRSLSIDDQVLTMSHEREASAFTTRSPHHRPQTRRSSSRQRNLQVEEGDRRNSKSPVHEGKPPHHNRSKANAGINEPRFIGYQEIKEMVEDENIESRAIALRLSTEKCGFSQRLKSNELHDGWVQLILKLFAKLSQSEERNHSFNRLLMMLIDCEFHFRVLKYLQSIFTANYVNKANATVNVTNILHLMRAWLIHIPNSSRLVVEMFLPFIKARLENHELEEVEKDSLEDLLHEVEELYGNCNKKHQEKVNPETLIDLHDEDPPDDFRSLSVFPTKNDIYDQNPFVRVNLTSSAYKSTEHYLDVQFRLLREDFVRPLREGISEFFNLSFQPGKKKQRLEGIKIYPNVRIEFPKLSSKGITYCLHFDIEKLKFVQWRNSKRLIYGNLICLSSDNFTENFLFASITDRSIEHLANGFIEVEFLNCEGLGANIDLGNDDLDVEELEGNAAGETNTTLITTDDMKKTYDMAESEAYFEAYRHVLSGLQETQTIPLRKYIVDCQQHADSPRYLRGLGRKATYDFAPIISKQGRSDALKPYDVLNTLTWPDAETLGLDASQVAALKSALTQELSIIQGPPGTGKTYVGLMIMKILLANRNSQAAKLNERMRHLNVHQDPDKCVPNGPILVVCYTNHALDQFLEGISSFHPNGLVRVGGRGKNKDLERYNLTNVRRNVTADRIMRKTFYDLRTELNEQVAAVEQSQDILKASTDSVLTLTVVESVMSQNHFQQLVQLAGKGNGTDPMLIWLGAQKKTHQLPEISYVVEETLEVVIQYYAINQVTRSRVLNAINCTRSLAPENLLVCLFGNHDHEDIDPFVNPDIVFEFLASYAVDVNLLKRLNNLGMQELEIKCACFVFASSPQLGLNEKVLIDWIQQKRGAEAADAYADEDDDLGANFEEEADYVQDQRMIDDVFIQIEQKDRKGRNTKPQVNKSITAAKHEDIVFTATDLEDGWQVTRQEKKRLQKLMRTELTKQDAFSDIEAAGIVNVFSLSFEEKWKLYRYWVQKLVAIRRKILARRSARYNSLIRNLNEMRNLESFQVLKNADVIAMTTTGAAKYRDMIYKLPVSIMIVEEAAEVLEAHIVTSMPQTTQHLILIGDHQQLKPSPTVYDLAKKYNLDMSLFERMVKNGIPCSRLELQHRMRPRIADLIRPHIYERLRDHESVMMYDDVIGVKSNIFFLSHTHLEDNVKDSKSKVNQHEANFMIGLCRYLLHQGYAPDRITILTAYVGQLLAFKKAVVGRLDKRVRITAVDNFQGEENDIILLSLVRSNEEGKIGFLSIENRVCVALSRAKKGLYCIGNFELLKEKSKLWRNILDELERDDLSGEEMPLQCKNHPETLVMVKCQKDFEKVPEGGCGKPCSFRLNCGHVCSRFCHPDDEEHTKYVCTKSCEKTCSEGHLTKLKCHQALKCKQLVEKQMPVCGHYVDIQCCKDLASVSCSKPCEKKLSCGHTCASLCGMKCTQQCQVLVGIDAACDHQAKVACSKKVSFDVRKCNAKCNEILQCDHPCKGTCGDCKQGRLHAGCSNGRCGRMLCCGHICQDNCTAVCPPCQRRCETSCRHSKCPKKCAEPCVLCTEKCGWKCEHYECTRLCSEPCNRPPCNKPCKEKLNKCGHICIGLCGEPCPKLCRVCDKAKVEEIFFGDEDEEDARFVQLECGHIFTYEGLDQWMKQENVDESSETDIKLKECPRCKTPIRKSARYGNIVNKTLMMINEVRQKISGNPEEVNENRATLLTALHADIDVKTSYSLQFEKLSKAALTAKSNPALSLVEFQYNCLAEFTQIKILLKKVNRASMLQRELEQRMAEIVIWLMLPRTYLSEQEQEDLSQERQRCKDALKLIQVKDKIIDLRVDSNANIDKYVKRIKKFVDDDLSSYISSKQDIVKDAFKKLNRLMPNLLPGLGITEDERKMILNVVGLSPGHWFKCKNGHVYLIGECGGATEESKCPECKETIGGTQHTLNPTNRLASEMDGATQPVWNPTNFDIPADVHRWAQGLI